MVLNNSESEKTEYKLNWNDDFLKIICAFANTEGGELIIGVDDKRNIIGLKGFEKLLEDLPNKIKDKLGIIPGVKIDKKEGKEIIRIITERSSVPISYNGKYYVRSGSTSQELRGQQLVNFIIKVSGKTWDEFIEDTAEKDEIDNESVEHFKELAMDRIPSITTEKDINTLFTKLNLTDKNKLKKGALLLFGKNPQRYYSQAIIKIGKFRNETEILSTDIVEGNLFMQLENTLEILRTKYLISEIKYEGIHRRDILEYPYDSLREAVINALIHRDYLGTSNIQIRIYPDKLIIMNEGKLPPEVPIETLKTLHLSKPRNSLLAKIFYYAGFIESWGRGTIEIVENCIKQGLPEPDFIEEYGTMKVVFYKDGWAEENLIKLGLNNRQIKAVFYVKEKGKITNKEYQQIVNTKERLSTMELKDLVNKKILHRFGITGRGTYYAAIKAQKTQKRRNKGAKDAKD